MNIKVYILMSFLLTKALHTQKCVRNSSYFRYHKFKNCHRSTSQIIATQNINNLQDCDQFAREKNGLAFNFGPPEYRNLSSSWYRNCQVLGCPETMDNSTLVFDPLFDYYTMYGNLNTTSNSTCVKYIGLFELITHKMNYIDAINSCQAKGADLADVLTESRTTQLSFLIKSVKSWYKAAYVGLADINSEGSFEAPNGNFLECTKYRAWGVGHPRRNRRHEDCVILDTDRMWRAINCKTKLQAICEFYPSRTVESTTIPKTRNCTKIRNKRNLKFLYVVVACKTIY